MQAQPPKWARRFLAWYCKPYLLEDIEGDLYELFQERVAAAGERVARRQYVWDVVRYLRPHTLHRRDKTYAKPLDTDMLRNYFTVALRHLGRNKVYSFLNVTGLASGIAVSLLILLFVQHELSYDSFHERAAQIFQASGEFQYGGQTVYMNGLTAPVAPAMQKSYPDVLAFVRTSSHYNHVLISRPGKAGKGFYEDEWLFADSSFLSVFSFKLLSGDRRTALAQPNAVLITPQQAEKYFGGEDPIGKTLRFVRKPNPYHDSVLVAREIPFTVTGIIEPAPSNSTLRYNFIASFGSLASVEKKEFDNTKVGIGGYPTYFLLRSEEAVGKIQRGLNKLVPALMPGMKQHLFLTGLTDLHLNGRTSGSNQKYMYIFSGVALLILLLALINYMSLTTARATQRAKEVGIRKVVGAARGQLIRQFFGESLFVTLLAFCVAILLMALLLSPFYRMIGVTIPVHFMGQPRFLLVGGSILILSGLLAGSYPALLLSKFLPVAVLKGKLNAGGGGASIRRVFTVFQFTASIALVICSLAVQRQLNLLRNKDLGLDKEQLVVIPVDAVTAGKSEALKTELSRQPGTVRVTASTSVPFASNGPNMMFSERPDKQQINLYFFNIDEQFIAAFGISWQEKTKAADLFTGGSNRVILNQTAVQKLGLGKDPVGKRIPFGGEQAEVVGVVKDFHFQSLQQAIEPLAMFPVPLSDAGKMFAYGGYLSVRLSPRADLPQSIARLEAIYRKYNPGKPFEYHFLDDTFDQLYKYHDRLANLSGAFTAFAILISCLGLFGLAAFTAERRTKEIGIRKVLGASVAGLVGLLSKDFLKLVGIAFIAAVPVAWYAVNQWLQDFAYKISMNWWLFALAGGMAGIIALFTVIFQAAKAALANPVDSLRNE
jgi:putative ABC transport system permease protein